MHDPVRDARIIENRPGRHEPRAFVEADGAHLRVRDCPRVAGAGGHVEKPLQDCGAHAETPPRREDRHSPDVAVRQYPPGTDGRTQRVQRQGVNTGQVMFVPFKGLGYTLLLDENPAPQRGQALRFHRPGHEMHAKGSRIHGHGF